MIAAATLFSGIGAPEVSMPDWSWLWHAEIEKFPAAVLAARHPSSINLGDVNAKDFVARARAIGRPDVLVFGSPCQDFSVAGQRLGLDGARGNLALRALGIAAELRPRWLVFENVPGLLSSSSGSAEAERSVRDGPVGGRADGFEDSDFAAFLATVQQCGYLGCYRITDAQFAGVPQRRRRIFFVGYLGDWRPAAAVLLEPESLRGDRPPSRATGERVAGSIRASATRRGGVQDEADADGLIAPPLRAGGSSTGNHGPGTDNDTADSLLVIPEVANTLTRRMHKGVNTTMDEGQTMIPVAFDCKAGGNTSFSIGEIPGSLRGEGHGGGHAAIVFDTTQITHPENRSRGDDRSPQLSATGHPPAVAFSPRIRGDDGRGYDREPNFMEEVSPTIDAMKPAAVAFQTRVGRNGRGGAEEIVPALNGADAGATSDMRPCVAVFKPSHFTRGKDGAPSDITPPLGAEPDKGDQDPVVMMETAVRRLTPKECCRLQGFPDDYLDITFRGKPAADGPRYKALGNAMNVREIGWVLQRIEQFERETST